MDLLLVGFVLLYTICWLQIEFRMLRRYDKQMSPMVVLIGAGGIKIVRFDIVQNQIGERDII